MANDLINHAFLGKEGSMKTSKESFQVVEPMRVWEERGLQRAWKLHALSGPLSLQIFRLAVPEFYYCYSVTKSCPTL